MQISKISNSTFSSRTLSTSLSISKRKTKKRFVVKPHQLENLLGPNWTTWKCYLDKDKTIEDGEFSVDKDRAGNATISYDQENLNFQISVGIKRYNSDGKAQN